MPALSLPPGCRRRAPRPRVHAPSPRALHSLIGDASGAAPVIPTSTIIEPCRVARDGHNNNGDNDGDSFTTGGLTVWGDHSSNVCWWKGLTE
ncbi:hypothetical protein IscW_ISCW000414 [Ixodes scapularis]|uniref:Uncharacterized protein n=1 Tax=Ixodes scapularis TaxID=6945 RepID=B7P3J9_IXOSC|nr:hypothetical protein IscW_ISCW000414 [Ixodes scapularis]|eukprot:XP_002404325.1 hypothetical protein IscW_ISCW000414 [Ixodes scapularis]